MKSLRHWLLIPLLLSVFAALGSNLARANALIYAPNTSSNRIDAFVEGQAGAATFIELTVQPSGIALDSAGNCYVSSSSNTVRKFSPTGADLGTLPSTGLSFPAGMACDSAGNLYVVNSVSRSIRKFSAAGSDLLNIVADTGLVAPRGMALDGSGNLYVRFSGSGVVKKYNSSGTELPVFLNLSATVINGVAVDAADNVYVSYGSTIRKYSSSQVDLGTFATLPSSGVANALAIDSEGSVYVSDGVTRTIRKFSAAGVDLGVVADPVTYLAQYLALRPLSRSLAASSVIVGPSAGSASAPLVSSPATAPWTAVANASWLHVALAGTGSGPVPVVFDANPGPTRTGTVTIAGLTFTVTQAGAGYVEAQPLTPLASTGLKYPFTVAVDGTGNVYIADANNNAVKKWTPATNTVTDVVATGLLTVDGVATDAAGNVYIADTGNNAIKKWTAPAGPVTTLVSTGLHNPYGVTVDALGNVYIADTSNNAIKKWTAATQTVSTAVSSGLSFPTAVAVDVFGNLYIADTGSNSIKKWTATTGTVTSLIASGLDNPSGVAVDVFGNVYIADNGHNAIKKWSSATQAITVLAASGLNSPQGLTVDAAGNVYLANSGSNAIAAIPRAFVDVSGSNVPATSGTGALSVVLPASANLQAPFTPTSDQPWLTVTGVTAGVVSYSYTANAGSNGRTAHINLLGQQVPVHQAGPTPTIIASSTNVDADANTFTIQGTGFDPVASGNIVILSNGAIGVVTSATPTSLTITLTTKPTSTGPITASVVVNGVASAGSVQVATIQAVNTLTAPALLVGASGGAKSITLVTTPSTAAWSATANAAWLHLTTANGTGSTNVIFTVDANGGAPRSGTLTIGGKTFTVTQAGANYDLTTVPFTVTATGLADPSGVALDSTGNLYIADYTNNQVKKWTRSTKTVSILDTTAAELNGPTGVAVDALGNVYIADSRNNQIKKWSPVTQTVSILDTSASPLLSPYGVAVDTAGNVYIADSDHNAIKKWTAATGVITTLAGGPISELNGPQGLAVDATGNVFIADTLNNAIQVWSPQTQTLTVLATGVNLPRGIAVDISGNVYASTFDHTIFKWTAASQTVSALGTGLNRPFGMATDAAGNLYLGDQGNNAVKELANAYVSAAAVSKGSSAGSDTLVYLPLNRELTGPFAPTSSQAWLTLDSVANGVISYSYTANTGGPRTAYLSVLGHQITITQGPDIIVNYNSGTLAANATTLLIQGSGFDTATPGNNIVYFNNGATGVVTASTAGSLTVTLTSPPTSAGALTAVVESGGSSNGAPVQVAIVPLALSTYNLLLDNAADSDTVVLSTAATETAWAASDDSAWLSLPITSGSGSTSFKLNFSANAAATRTATVTVGGLTLSVTQPGSSHQPATAVPTLVDTEGLNFPAGVAVDRAGSVYISDYGDDVVRKWNPVTGRLTTLNTSAAPLDGPQGLAVDHAGAVYIADSLNNQIKRWSPVNNSVSIVDTSASPVNEPVGVAVDGTGNLYIGDSGNGAVKKWDVITHQMTVLAHSLNTLQGVAVDAAGNVYYTYGNTNGQVAMWKAQTQTITPLITTGLNVPRGLAVDVSGNVFVGDTSNNVVKVWQARNQTVTTVVPGLNSPFGVAVDGNRSVYVVDQGTQSIKSRPRAFVDITPQNLSAAAGLGTLSRVLPLSQSLVGPFAPTSNQWWLQVDGTVNSLINTYQSINLTGAARPAQIGVLGVNIPVTQQSGGTGIGAWRTLWFGSSANTGNGADTVDPNNNGVRNLVEYALDGDPTGNTTGGDVLPVLSISSGNKLQISFYRYLDRTDLTLTVQASENLTTWTDLAQSVNGAAFTVITAGTTIHETGTDGFRTVTVEDLYQISDPAHPRRFMRLKVTGP